MKILIVDDNEAVQEIIRDILAERDHNVRLASTVDEAVEKIGSFEPDVVMLDSWVGDEDGMRVISRSREEYPGVDLKVILIKTASEVAPTDNQYIKGWVDKPFKSSDILEAVENLKISEAAAEVAETQRKTRMKQRQRSERGGFLHRRKEKPVEALPDLEESGIVYGRSYVMFEPEPDPSDIQRQVRVHGDPGSRNPDGPHLQVHRREAEAGGRLRHVRRHRRGQRHKPVSHYAEADHVGGH